LQTRTPKADVPVVRLDKSKAVTVRNVVPWPGVGTYLSVAPGMKSEVSTTVTVKEEESDPWKSINTPDRRR
jgi:hypothetical protein